MKSRPALGNLFLTLPEKAGRRLSDFLLLLLRVVWGWQLMQAGWGKLHHLDNTAKYFGELGIPAPHLNAAAAGAAECFGGALLLAGLFSRIVSIPLIFTMSVAVLTAERDKFIGTAEDPVTGFDHVTRFFDTTPGPFLVALLVVFCFGAGKFSLDSISARLRDRPGLRRNEDDSASLPAKPLE